MTFLDHVAAIAAGFILCMFAVVASISIARCVSGPDLKPWTNTEIMLAVEHCERLGLATEFEPNFSGRVVGLKCGSSGE